MLPPRQAIQISNLKNKPAVRSENSPWLPLQNTCIFGNNNRGRGARKSLLTVVISSDLLLFVLSFVSYRILKFALHAP